jgi:hypothetical protein
VSKADLGLRYQLLTDFNEWHSLPSTSLQWFLTRQAALFPTHHRSEKGFRSHEASHFWRTADRIYVPHLNHMCKIYTVLKIKDK